MVMAAARYQSADSLTLTIADLDGFLLEVRGKLLRKLPGSRSSCARIVLVLFDVLCLVFPFLALIQV
jgi:hypothetical protein